MGPMRGRFSVGHLVQGDMEQLRRERIGRAYKNKLGKLSVWKESHNARTVLILEENDIQLTNAQRIADAVVEIERIELKKPDEIFLVSTCLDDVWWVTPIRCGNRSYYDFNEPGERFAEFSPLSLEPVTPR